MVIPQSAFDVALTLLPFGKPGKALAAGILGLIFLQQLTRKQRSFAQLLANKPVGVRKATALLSLMVQAITDSQPCLMQRDVLMFRQRSRLFRKAAT